MKLAFASLLLLCAACSTAKPRVELLGGVRNFDDSSNWENTDKQVGGGVQFSVAEKDGYGVEVGYIQCRDVSTDSNYPFRLDDTGSKTEELYIGLRRNWMLSESFQLVTSGGVSANMLESDFDLTWGGNAKSHSVAYAPYAQIGLNYLFGEHWSAGLIYRRTFWGEENEAIVDQRTTDNNTFLFSVGYGF
jgi:opacity protein-like surface antigen